jgi:hypothetical protein
VITTMESRLRMFPVPGSSVVVGARFSIMCEDFLYGIKEAGLRAALPGRPRPSG